MSDLRVGEGKLAGNGVYATRDFAVGDLVVPYRLKALDQRSFDELPQSEREWTHSFWAKIFLFPEPERLVNHSDEPNCFPDLKRMGNYAVRAIKAGDMITIDDRIELRHELDTFRDVYEASFRERSLDELRPLIAEDATFWFGSGVYEGRDAVREALQNMWKQAPDSGFAFSDRRWIATNYWVSSCAYRMSGKVPVEISTEPGTLVTCVMRRIQGSWRIAHEHHTH